MVDINRWHYCVDGNPDKKGKYLLLIGLPVGKTGYTEIGVIEAMWNGKAWLIDSRYSISRWKYKKPGEIEKYPDFEGNLRRNSL